MIEVLKKGNRQGMKMKEIAEAMGVKQSVTSALVLNAIKDGTVLKSENTIDGVYLYSLANYDGYAENIKPVEKPKLDKIMPGRLENAVKFISEKVNSPLHYTNGSIECIYAM
jgi:DNA-binding MarR family transcriptional regulator